MLVTPTENTIFCLVQTFLFYFPYSRKCNRKQREQEKENTDNRERGDLLSSTRESKSKGTRDSVLQNEKQRVHYWFKKLFSTLKLL